MKKILVLTDFSANSVNAYGYAVKLACHLKAEILLLFSTNGSPLSLTDQFQYSQQLHSFATRYACDSRRKINPLNTECLISGDAWQTLLPNMVSVHQPDLILAGSALLPLLDAPALPLPLESLKSCPILWIPEKAIYQKYEHLVFATDFTDQDAGVLSAIDTLAQEFKANVSLVHFYGGQDLEQWPEIKKAGDALCQSLQSNGGCHLVEEEDMMEGIQELAGHPLPDVFVIGTRDLHLTHQYLNQVFRKTNSCLTSIPLLAFYQAKTKPCTGSCAHCQEEHEKQAHHA